MFTRLFPALFLSAFLLVVIPSSAQPPASLDDLDGFIEKAMKDFEIPGLAIGVVKDGEIVYQKGFGLRDNTQKAKVDPNSVFAIASLSKAFTAATVATLVDDGKLDWDDKVSDYLPNFKLHDDYISSQLTVRDLLCHRSGLRTFDGDLLWYGTDHSREDILSRIRELPVKYDFRARFGYQNIMFLAAGELVPAVTGKSWDDYLKERVFGPLGMNSTYSSIDDYPKDLNLAMPHVKGKPDQLLHYDNSGGAAALNSSVADMCNWIKLWLDNGKFGDQEVLSPKSVNTIFTQHTPLNVWPYEQENGTHFKGYGLGWFLMDYQGVKVVHHGGGLPGYISKLALVPEQDLGIIVLTNGMSSLPSALMYQVIDIVNGRTGKDWTAQYLKWKAMGEDRDKKAELDRLEARVSGTSPSKKPEDLTGSYEDDMYGKAVIGQENGKLSLQMLPTRELFTGELVHWHYDTYQVQFKDRFLPAGYVTFSFNSNGEVEGFTIDLPNPDFHFYNLEFKRL